MPESHVISYELIHLSTVQKVAKNTGIIIVGDVIFKLLSLIVIIYLAKYLGSVVFGKYSFVFAYLAFFSIITDLGLHAILVREISRDPSITPKLIGNVYVIKLILAVFAIALSMVIITLMSYPADTTSYIYIASFMLLFMSFNDLYTTLFQANLRMKYIVIAKLTSKFLYTGLLIWLIFLHGTIMQIIVALLFAELVKTLVSYLFSRKIVKAQFKIDFGLWKYLFKEALPLALSSVIWVIYYQIDIVMLSPMVGDAAVGIYAAAHKLFEPFSLIPFSLMMVLFPIMSKAFKTSPEKLMLSYRLSLKYLSIIALPIAIGTTLLSDKIILLIYGTDFANSAGVLQILSWSLVFIFPNFVLLNLLIAIDKQKLNIFSMGLCAIVNVTLNFILIPMLSYNGAAIATLITNIILLIANFYFVSKHLQVLPMTKIMLKTAISGLLMGVFIYCFIDINVFLLVPLAGMIYLAALFVFREFKKEDIDLLKKIVSKNKK